MTTTTTRNGLLIHESADINFPYGTNTNMETIDDALAKCNFTAATDPGSGDDSADGYSAGSKWHNTTAGRAWVCKVATAGAAVWWQVAIAGVAFDFGAVEVRARTFQSDIATGAGAPFVVASDAKVVNLNADKLDDLEGAAYAILVGQAGGQTLEGDTASGGNLTLKSTHHATTGNILLEGGANSNYSITYGAKCAAHIRQGGAELAFGVHSDSPWPFWIQARISSNTAHFLAINPLGGGVCIGGTTNPGDNNLYVVGDINCASVIDHTPGYEGDALAELDLIKSKDGEIDHTLLPEFCQREYTDAEGKPQIGRDIGGMVSVLTVGIQQLKEFYEKAVEERDKKIADLVVRLEKLETATKV